MSTQAETAPRAGRLADRQADPPRGFQGRARLRAARGAAGARRHDRRHRLLARADLRGGDRLEFAHGAARRLRVALGAGVSMGWSEALSDTGEQTGRGSAVVRGAITGGMTTLGRDLPHPAVPHLRRQQGAGRGGCGRRDRAVRDRVGAQALPQVPSAPRCSSSPSAARSCWPLAIGDRSAWRLLMRVNPLVHSAFRAAARETRSWSRRRSAQMRAVDAVMECLEGGGRGCRLRPARGREPADLRRVRTTRASVTSWSATRPAAGMPPRATPRPPARSASRSRPAGRARPTWSRRSATR